MKRRVRRVLGRVGHLRRVEGDELGVQVLEAASAGADGNEGVTPVRDLAHESRTAAVTIPFRSATKRARSSDPETAPLERVRDAVHLEGKDFLVPDEERAVVEEVEVGGGVGPRPCPSTRSRPVEIRPLLRPFDRDGSRACRAARRGGGRARSARGRPAARRVNSRRWSRPRPRRRRGREVLAPPAFIRQAFFAVFSHGNGFAGGVARREGTDVLRVIEDHVVAGRPGGIFSSTAGPPIPS